MRSLKTSLAALTLFLATACASAPPPPPPPPPAAPTSTAEIDRSLVWTETRGGPRHIASGFICPPSLGTFRFTEETIYPGSRPGFDVSCGYVAEAGGAITFYLTSFERPLKSELYLSTSVRAIEESLPVTGPVAAPALPNGDPITPWAAAFLVDLAAQKNPEESVASAVWIEEIGAWHVKARATYEDSRSDAVAAAVGILFQRARLTIEGGTT